MPSFCRSQKETVRTTTLVYCFLSFLTNLKAGEHSLCSGQKKLFCLRLCYLPFPLLPSYVVHSKRNIFKESGYSVVLWRTWFDVAQKVTEVSDQQTISDTIKLLSELLLLLPAQPLAFCYAKPVDILIQQVLKSDNIKHLRFLCIYMCLEYVVILGLFVCLFCLFYCFMMMHYLLLDEVSGEIIAQSCFFGDFRIK